MQEETELREELLSAAAPPEEVQEEAPKKNTKQALLNKILEVSEKGGYLSNIRTQNSNA